MCKLCCNTYSEYTIWTIRVIYISGFSWLSCNICYFKLHKCITINCLRDMIIIAILSMQLIVSVIVGVTVDVNKVGLAIGLSKIHKCVWCLMLKTSSQNTSYATCIVTIPRKSQRSITVLVNDITVVDYWSIYCVLVLIKR